ncbi:sensor histidine kinase [Sphingomonas nostoxanthinifaciens]|uniref:sensor histidine kinase n=1 Tax=Sphingomonas nostoxanthinifaciens TaxID=2872652 RepID=UPI001CC2103A|nr:HAMP domain-containing sensor histidine kinase [Sphingomonas nostoxanthinifaciens]UAK25953.1 HAMP domain-containing histidine kinase [Sphingomonas nostoxanthinifaciens]
MPSERLRLRDIRGTSTFRLTVLLGGVFAIGLTVLIGLVYFLTARELTARNDRILHAQAARLLSIAAADLPRQLNAELARSTGFTHMALLAADGEHIAGDIRVDRPIRPGHAVELNSPLGPIRIIAIRTRWGETILVGRDIAQIHYLRGRVLLILVTGGIVTLVGLTAAAVLLSIGPLRRVRDLEQAAREIAGGRMEVRMPIAGRGDELDQIAGTVNLMVDEIGRVIAQVKGVTDAVAHDLRTPLAHVRAHLLALARLPEAAPIAAAALADLDAVLQRFAALLRIAEIEAGARRARFEPIDLALLAAEAVELYEPLAEEGGIVLRLEAPLPAPVHGDRLLLLEALSNLIDNAIKFAKATITVSVASDPNGATLSVIDDGAGIPVGERQAVLRRFHRGANAAGVPGNGLGLSIVAAVGHLHGFELRLEDSAPGLAVRLHAASQVKII